MVASPVGSVDKSYNGGQQIESVDSATPQRRSFGQKVGAHFKKWWWLHLIIFCISFLIIALCIVYVAFPRIAQHGVNDASLTINSIAYLAPAPDHLTLAQNATLHSKNTFTPTLSPFNATLWLVTAGQFAIAPLLIPLMPKIHATDKRIITFNQTLPIQSEEQVAAYSTAVLVNETLSSGITGRPKLHLGKLPVNTVKFNQTVSYKGLNGLKGFNTTDVRINITKTTGENLAATAFIPNPSFLTIELGNVSLALAIGNVSVGSAQINEMTIRPGDNHFPMTGTLNQTLVLQNYNSTTGIANMSITGDAVVYNGLNIPYYETAFKSNVLHLEMNVTQIIRDSLGL